MSDLWWGSSLEMDDDQKKATLLPVKGNHLVVGPPGCGKTNLLLLRAKRLIVGQSSDIRIIVFTRSLRDFVSSGAPRYDIPPNRITTAMKMMDEQRYSLGLQNLEPGLSLKEKRRVLAHAISEHMDRYAQPFLVEHLLIDEVQDYTNEEIGAFQKLGKYIYAVGDTSQRIQVDAKDSGMQTLRNIAPVTTLTSHYRNGLEICKLADKLAARWNPSTTLERTSQYDEGAHPSSVRVFQFSSLLEQVREALKHLDAALRVYPNHEFAFLAYKRESVAEIGSILFALGRRASFQELGEDEGISTEDAPKLWFGTAHSAKGCEFRAVYVFDSEHFKGPNIRELAYTTTTRARTILSWYHTNALPAFLHSALFDDPSKAHDVSIDELFK